MEMEQGLAKVIYDEIGSNIAFGGKTKKGVIVLEADHLKLSYDIEKVVMEYIKKATLKELKDFVLNILEIRRL